MPPPAPPTHTQGPQTFKQSTAWRNPALPLPIPALEGWGFWLPPRICFLNPNLGVGVRFPVRAGRGGGQPEGHRDTGQSDWPHTPTGVNLSCEWCRGQRGATRLAQECSAGARTAPGSHAVGAGGLDPALLQTTTLSRSPFTPILRPPFTVLGDPEASKASTLPRPLHHSGGACPECQREGSLAVGRAG